MPFLGCVCDDITGASDLAGALVGKGIPTIQVFGVPGEALAYDADAVVVALKSRTAPVDIARKLAQQSAKRLRDSGITHVFDKYCSTFDSTADGNIGPIADALLGEFRTSMAVHCPAYPANERTVYNGHLFVGKALLSDTGMRDHPLTPMTDSNLVRVLQRQTAQPVGLLPLGVLRAGATAARSHLRASATQGVVHLVADAITDADIEILTEATWDWLLPAGAAAFGAAIGARLAGSVKTDAIGCRPVPPPGPTAILVGSASSATVDQVARFERAHPVLRLTPQELNARPDTVHSALRWAEERLPHGPVMVGIDSRPAAVALAHRELGGARAAALGEAAVGELARGLVAMGVRRLIVAGGESSGAVAAALDVAAVHIGAEICTGVPWTITLDGQLGLVFKSGNFGGPDFFTDAITSADRTTADDAP